MILPALPLHATGDYWVSPTYLDGSGHELKSPPEFFWHQEIQRLAAKYRDKDSAGLKARGLGDGQRFLTYGASSEETDSKTLAKAASAPDVADFEDALKTGRLKPADGKASTEVHKNARAAIDAGRPLPGGEMDSEFADYHAGAAAPHTPEAAAAWKKLLARPKEERHYRSVWAAFMLGKNALAAKQWTDAVKYFEQCRALAREGFADSLALAADSYGWQGRAELMAEHYPQAARLYLTQLSLSDLSAVVSLKRMIPEWTSLASGGPPGEPVETDSDNPAAEPTPANKLRADARWLEAAHDPVLHELVTAHILATDSASFGADSTRGRHWLDVINTAGLKKVEDATALAWVAYTAGDYKAAKAWLAKAEGATPLGRWLEAKFALREGNLDAAAKLMPGVVQGIRSVNGLPETVTPADHAHGEAAALLFAKGQYAEAFETFLKGHCDEDVKYMIESVLTTEELLVAAAKIPAPKPSAKPADGAEEATGPRDPSPDEWRVIGTRSLIGRRLIREGKVKEGRAFLTDEERKVMDEYIALTVKAENAKVPAADRAQAWWEAANMMLEQGHEFRGTEADFHKPDLDSSDFTIRRQRLTGKYEAQPDYNAKEPQKPAKLPVFIPATEEEKKRLAATAKQHAKAMRTRMVAASHVQKAAALLPNGSEQKARALNTAGFWLQDIDNPAADKIYSQMEKSLSGTPTGKAVLKKRWFTGTTDPWNETVPE